MKVLGLDIATQTGIAVGSSGRDPQCWSVDLGKGRSQVFRYNGILTLTHGLIQRHKPDLIVIEAPIGGGSASAYLISLANIAHAVSFNNSVKCELVFPATVRKHFLGKAYTSKHFPGLKQAKAKIAIKELVKKRAETMGWVVPDLDAADAAATWDWACATHVPTYQSKPQGGLF